MKAPVRHSNNASRANTAQLSSSQFHRNAINSQPMATAQSKMQQAASNFVAQKVIAQRKQVLANKGVVQRVNPKLVGTDNDYNKVQEYPGHILDNIGNHRYKKISIGDIKDNSTGVKIKKDLPLKSYFIEQNNFNYRLAIRHKNEPKQLSPTSYEPNAGNPNLRGLQPEPFGGTVDRWENTWDAATREYGEESHLAASGLVNWKSDIVFSTSYHNLRTGTMVEVGGRLGTIESNNINSTGGFDSYENTYAPATTYAKYGEAEMLGTIVIDCQDLANGTNSNENALQGLIADKITTARNSFLSARGITPPTQGPFEVEGGVLGHIVSLMAKEIAEHVATRSTAVLTTVP